MMILPRILLLVASSPFAATVVNGIGQDSVGNLMYRRYEDRSCQTLQTIPGNNNNNNGGGNVQPQQRQGGGTTSFENSEGDCQQLCTQLGKSCLGYEVSTVPGSAIDLVTCTVWDQRPVETSEAAAVASTATTVCALKEFLTYSGDTCNDGFISRTAGTPPVQLSDLSLDECNDECSERTGDDINKIPIFDYTAGSGRNCFGYEYNSATRLCKIYDSPLVSIRQGGSDGDISNMFNDGDDTICLVRSQTITPAK